MAITASDIGAFIGRYNNKVLLPQVNMAAPILKAGVLDKLDRPQERGTINIAGNGFSSVKSIADGGSLPSGDAITPVQANYDPTTIFGRVSVPRTAAAISRNVSDGVDMLKAQLELVGDAIGRHLGRAVYSGSVYTRSGGTVSAATPATFTVTDPSGWRTGYYDIYNGSSFVETIQVTDVAIGTSSTTITVAELANDLVNGYDVYLPGTYANALTSLADVNAAANLYGKSYTANDWSGNLDSTTTTLTASALKSLIVRVRRRSGMKPTHLLMSPLGFKRLYEASDDNIRHVNGKVDPYSFRLMFDGIECFEDENCPDSSIHLHQKKTTKLHCMREFGPDIDGAQKPGMGYGAALVSASTHTYDIQIWGAYQLRCERRNACGHMSALTA